MTELARRLGLGKSTVHRLLATLTAERILEHDPATGTYRLGLMMWELGARVSVHRVLHDAAATVIEELRNATKETVQLAVLDGREVVYVERLESPHMLRIFGRVGHRNSAHCTSTGKVLLAHLPERRLAALLEGWRPERKTDATVCDPGTAPGRAGPGPGPGVGREHRRERARRGQRGRPGPQRPRRGDRRRERGRAGDAGQRRHPAPVLPGLGRPGRRRHLRPARLAPPRSGGPRERGRPGRAPGRLGVGRGRAPAARRRPGPVAVPGPPRAGPGAAADRGAAGDDRRRGLRRPAPPGRAAPGRRRGRRRRLQARPDQPGHAGPSSASTSPTTARCWPPGSTPTGSRSTWTG